MNKPIPLSALADGQSGRISSVTLTGPIRRRLRDLGMIEGTKIKCLQKGPSGDPIAFFVRGTAIAIRRKDASCIHIC